MPRIAPPDEQVKNSQDKETTDTGFKLSIFIMCSGKHVHNQQLHYSLTSEQNMIMSYDNARDPIT